MSCSSTSLSKALDRWGRMETVLEQFKLRNAVILHYCSITAVILYYYSITAVIFTTLMLSSR